MARIDVQPRDTPGERAETAVAVSLDDDLNVLVEQLVEWTAVMEHWDLQLREGHEFDRANNVEARFLFAGSGGTSSLVFRIDQLESVQELDRELWLTFDEADGIAKAVHVTPLGMDVELFHIAGPPLGGTSA